MKFRDPKTREVFDSLDPKFIPLYGSYEIEPAETARLMGYEVIEDNVQKTFTETDLLAVLDKLADSCDTSNTDESVTGDKLFDYHWKCGNANAVNFIKSALGIGRPEKTVKEVNMEKMDKPRLAEVLGVEVEERFTYRDGDKELPGLFIRKDGYLYDSSYQIVYSGLVCSCINHPESIIRAPRLTEAERERCRVYGAKWVSMDKHGDSQVNFVRLWDKKPKEFEKVNGWIFEPSVGDHSLALVYKSLFPSVKPGDLVSVEDCGDA